MTSRSATIYVDADACPVKEEIIAVHRSFQMELVFVANKKLVQLSHREGFETVVTDDEYASADVWILKVSQVGDVLITADLNLSREALEKLVLVFSFWGKELNFNNINELLVQKEIAQWELENWQSSPTKKQNIKKKVKGQKSHFKNQLHNFLIKKFIEYQK